MLRAYQIGDEKKINMSDESAEDWKVETEYGVKHLEYDETYTCIDSKRRICGIFSFCWQGDCTYYAWAIFDRKRGRWAVRDLIRLIDLYSSSGKLLYTVSIINERQSQLHEMCGFEKREKQGDKQVWVKYSKRQQRQ